MSAGRSDGTKQLTTEQRQRVRVLYFDTAKSQAEISRITGYTKAHIRTAICARDAGAHRGTSRPRTLTPDKKARRMGFLELSKIIVARPKILWTDETWVTGSPHREQYITRRPGEESDPTCIGKINAETYGVYTIPVIHGSVQLYKEQLSKNPILMQDGAPGHTATEIKEDLRERGITMMEWPPFSSDLNPIDLYSLEEKPTYNKSICQGPLPDNYLKELLASMLDRCKAVIAAKGILTEY
ncbi:hypothetical protein N657DRAFT_658449 [Parathielavia appendiculata]|uniref:Uncharacterized protein n=1 Tax=Parathielavia appendiculata TaxID=2587402 RepID=A0AAN6TTP4_9PEZI|nr:hypothetical protein N657DRAFT_658449 [Parathielavia appendiculata]